MASERLRRFIYVTGFLDYFVGISAAAPAFMGDDPQQFASLLPLGAFLAYAAATLMWASKDLATRGCVAVWQGLVRLTAVGATLVAIMRGMPAIMARLYGMDEAQASAMLYGVCVFDSVVATTYIVGLARSPGHTLGGLLRGRPAVVAAD